MRAINSLFVSLSKNDFQARAVSIEHLRSLEEEIVGNYEKGLLDNEFYQERLTHFDFGLPKTLDTVRSLIVAAVPRPQTRAIFEWKKMQIPLTIPPTYTAYDETRRKTEDLIKETISKQGYSSARANLPLKLLAVRSGLGQYGRNNISYVPGFGSFHQLVAVYSDLSVEDDLWQDLTMMEACEKCELCRQACPSGAISNDRFLLHTERCLVYHNEKKGDIPFPEWLNSSWHNCLIGCMYCQRVCPANGRFVNWFGIKEEFSERETSQLLSGVTYDELPSVTQTKLKHLDIDYLDILPRNLGVFLNRT